MNNDTESIESLLRGLNPAAPNPEVRERVKADLTLDEAWLPRQVRRAPRWIVATGWAGLGAAAAVAVMGLVMRDFAPTSPPTASFAGHRAALTVPAPAGKVWSVTDNAWVEVKAQQPTSLDAKPEPKAVLPVNFQ